MKAFSKELRRGARKAVRGAAIMAVGGAVLLPALPAQAQQMVTAGWYNAGLLTRVHPGDGSGYFAFSTATQFGIAACPNNTLGYMFSQANAAANRNFALLLTAYSTGKPVAIHFTGACEPGTGRPIADTVEMTDVGYF